MKLSRKFEKLVSINGKFVSCLHVGQDGIPSTKYNFTRMNAHHDSLTKIISQIYGINTNEAANLFAFSGLKQWECIAYAAKSMKTWKIKTGEKSKLPVGALMNRGNP